MSPPILNRHLQQPEKSKSITSGISIRTPGQWFRTSANQSVPNLVSSQHPNRVRGLVSIRNLARSIHREPSPDDQFNVQHPPPSRTLRSTSSLYGTLRDQCTPPELIDSTPAVPGRFPSQSSSDDSYTPDQSGVSNDSSHPTTPSPAKHRAFDQLETSSYAPLRIMGNKGSSILRKPLSLKGKHSRNTIKGETKDDRKEDEDRAAQSSGSPEAPQTIPTIHSGPKQKAAKAATVTPNVPRRRSSLTTIHLNSAHFDSVDPNQAQLQHRASTLTEPCGRRPSTLSDTLQPVLSSIGPSTPVTQIDLRETLSPASQSPPLSPSQSDPSSANPRQPVPNQHLYFPKTFPDGPITVPAPPLTIVHLECYQQHRRVMISGNTRCPVPCMACKGMEEMRYWKCVWCGLRICAICMRELDRRGRDLRKLVAWVEEKKERQKLQKENEPQGQRHAKSLSTGGPSLEQAEPESTPGDNEDNMEQSDKDVQGKKGLAGRQTRNTA